MTRYLLHGIQDRYSALYQENLDRLGGRDVVVASIGSSGQSFLGAILAGLGLNYADPYTEAVYPDGTSTAVPVYADYRDRLPGHGPPRRMWPRFLKTHLTPEFFSGSPIRGAWLLVRDPRDALYSWYRFRAGFVRDPLDLLATGFDDWLVRPGPTGADRIEDWTGFYRAWLTHGVAAVTTFEDLKADPVPTLTDALRAFGITEDATNIRAAVRAASFDVMRGHERARGGEGPGILRRGRPGEWRDWMPAETLAAFDRPTTTALAARFGYHLGDGKESAS